MIKYWSLRCGRTAIFDRKEGVDPRVPNTIIIDIILNNTYLTFFTSFFKKRK